MISLLCDLSVQHAERANSTDVSRQTRGMFVSNLIARELHTLQVQLAEALYLAPMRFTVELLQFGMRSENDAPHSLEVGTIKRLQKSIAWQRTIEQPADQHLEFVVLRRTDTIHERDPPSDTFGRSTPFREHRRYLSETHFGPDLDRDAPWIKSQKIHELVHAGLGSVKNSSEIPERLSNVGRQQHACEAIPRTFTRYLLWKAIPPRRKGF